MVIMIRNPLKESEKRTRIYIGMAFVSALFFTLLTRGKTNGAGYVLYMFEYVVFVFTSVPGSIWAH